MSRFFQVLKLKNRDGWQVRVSNRRIIRLQQRKPDIKISMFSLIKATEHVAIAKGIFYFIEGRGLNFQNAKCLATALDYSF